jgi:uncharacterized protein (TIGR03437 family)
VKNRTVWLVIAAILYVLPCGPQSGQPSISFASFPAWGQDGDIAGTVSIGSQSLNVYLFAFVPDMGWIGLPGSCAVVPVQRGTFDVSATPLLVLRNATRFSAYMVPLTLPVSCVGVGTGTIPFVIEHNAVASVTVPRLPRYSTISFAGMQWYVKDAPVPVYPGPQFFVKDNAFLDSQGQLHLRISRCGNSWCAAEVFTKDTIGFGTYRFDIASQVASLDPNVTLGLFSWDAQAGEVYNREWDIEFSRWGVPSATTNTQFVVQPYNLPNNIQHFLINQSTPTSHVVNWSPSQMSFTSSTGSTTIRQWTFVNGATTVPTLGDAHLHLNFYLGSGTSPTVPVTQEIVISGFQYMPAAAQIGFSRSADTVTFEARSYSVPLQSTDANCIASVEADVPWLSVASKRIPPGLPLQYSVLENTAKQSRSGNLILQSSNCNATIGAQVLTITQSSLVCAPVFAPPSSHLGFLSYSYSIGVKGNYAPCTWSASSSVPWLRIVSPTSGAGDGVLQLSADGNTDGKLRGTVLSLDNGALHSVYQDAAGVYFAISPRAASACGKSTAPFGLSWSAPVPVEIRLNSPTGTIVGQFGAQGTTTLPAMSDGVLILLMDMGGNILGSARTSVTADCGVSAIAPLGVVNAASFGARSLAPGSLGSIFGAGLATGTTQASGTTYPTSLGAVSVTLAGQLCPLWYVSPGQINFAVPPNIPAGRYAIQVGSATSEVLITELSPGLFTVKGDGTGVPLATVSAVSSDGTITALTPYQCFASGCFASPMPLPDGLTDLYIVLYGTGIRNAREVTAAMGSQSVEVTFFGGQAQFPGLDQVNLHMKSPATLSGSQALSLEADGISSNTVQLVFR